MKQVTFARQVLKVRGNLLVPREKNVPLEVRLV